MSNTNTITAIPRSWSNVGILSTSHFMSDFFSNVLPIMLPILALRFDISYAQCAALFMGFSVVMNFLQPIIGMLSDRKSINFLMPLSILATAILASLIGLAPNIYILVIIVFLCGLATAAFHPISAGILATVMPEDRPTFATSIYIAGGNVGFAISPLIVAWFIETFSDKSLPLLSVIAIATVIVVFVKGLHKNYGSKDTKLPEISFSFMLKSKEFLLLNTVIALRSWGYCAFIVFLPLLLSNEGYGTVAGASALMVAMSGCVAGGLVGGGLSDRYGQKAVIMGTIFVALISFAYFALNPRLEVGTYIALFLAGAGLYGSTAPAIVWVQHMLKNAAAFAASLMLGFSFGVGYVETLLTGIVADFVGLQLALLYTVVPAIALSLVLACFLKSPKTVKEVLN